MLHGSGEDLSGHAARDSPLEGGTEAPQLVQPLRPGTHGHERRGVVPRQLPGGAVPLRRRGHVPLRREHLLRRRGQAMRCPPPHRVLVAQQPQQVADGLQEVDRATGSGSCSFGYVAY
jgi:hypothetical protein